MQITFGSSFWKSSLKKMEIKYQIYMFILIPLDQKYPALLSSSTFPSQSFSQPHTHPQLNPQC